MAQDEIKVVGKVPDFTDENPAPVRELEEVKQPEVEIPPEEKVTLETPAEKPDDEVIVDNTVPSHNVDNPDLVRAVNGLQEERVKLLKEISELRGQKREIAQDHLERVEKQLDDLKDLHPEDVTLIDRVLRAKGFVTKEEANRMFYDSVKQEELNKFLESHPEYKPENDPGDTNWSTLTRELGIYRTPENPHLWSEILTRAHRSIVKVPIAKSPIPVEVKKRQIEVASHGGGGKTNTAPTNTKTLTPEHKAMLKQGGFTDEDIQGMESRLK